jgi:transposase
LAEEAKVIKRYRVDLTEEERAHLLGMTQGGKAAARRVRRAQTLLLAADGHPDRVIAAMLHIGHATVERTRQRFVEEGFEAALAERPRPGSNPKLDGKQEAFLVALACTPAPEGRKCWTMQLLADRLVAVGVIEAISDETVRRTLKKGTSSPGSLAPGASQR